MILLPLCYHRMPGQGVREQLSDRAKSTDLQDASDSLWCPSPPLFYRWRNVYAGELEVRPPGAPTTDDAGSTPGSGNVQVCRVPEIPLNAK
jgi:hypothetical protein